MVTENGVNLYGRNQKGGCENGVDLVECVNCRRMVFCPDCAKELDCADCGGSDFTEIL
jgi:hypothetical protein